MQHHMLMKSSAHPKWHVNITNMSSTNAFSDMCACTNGAQTGRRSSSMLMQVLREEARGAPQGD